MLLKVPIFCMKKEVMMSKNVKRILIVLGIIFGIVIIEYFELRKKINLSYVVEHREYLESVVAHNYLFSVLAFISFYIGSVILLLPITIILNLVGGYFFSTIPGFIYCMIGFMCGSLLSFLFFRYLFRDYLMKRYGQAYAKLNQQFQKNGIMFLISLQLFPITPLPVITMLGALSTISIWSYIMATMVGAAPSILIYVFAGKKLLQINSPKEILSFPVLIALLLLASLTFLPMVVRYIQDRNKRNHEIPK